MKRMNESNRLQVLFSLILFLVVNLIMITSYYFGSPAGFIGLSFVWFICLCFIILTILDGYSLLK